MAGGDVGLDRIHHQVPRHAVERHPDCWLALWLIRVAENTAERPWTRIRDELQGQQAVTWTGAACTFRQITDLAKSQRDIYTALSIEPPKKILVLNSGTPGLLTCTNTTAQ